ncbi:MAG TPA: GGDEF domain-containing protein, partial [Nevskiaceae bacterium]|nr:GGDEF domain-containing protein [Nevskiaceae bacterium]
EMGVSERRRSTGETAHEPAAAARLRQQYYDAISRQIEHETPGLIRRRIAQAVAMAGVLAFILVDYFSDGAARSGWAAQLDWKLIATVLPLIVLPIAYAFPQQRRMALGQYALMGMFVIALALAGAMDIGRGQRAWLNFESLMLVTIYIYFISGLPLFRAIFCGLCAWLAFTVARVETPGVSLAAREIYYLLAANVVGTIGLGYMERSARERFGDQFELRVTAMIDSLTGVLNRGAVRSHIERTWRQAQREDKTYAMLLADLDQFKSINDVHGHPVGDACLMHVADVLSKLARRPLDAVGRWGGDEFVAVWYDLDARHFSTMLKDLPAAIAQFKPAPNVSTMEPLSLTGGAVLVLPGGQHDFSEVMEQADALLYKAKRSGRGQILTALAVDLDAGNKAA